MNQMVMMALTATILYGSQNVVIKQWLGEYSAPVLLLCFYTVGMVISTILVAVDMYRGKAIVFPTGNIAWATVAAGAAYCVADYFMIGALKHATSVAVTSVLLLTPVFAGVGTFIAVHAAGGSHSLALPNRYEFATLVLVVATLAVFQKSQEVRKLEESTMATSALP